MLNITFYTECLFAKCRYAECHYIECRGALAMPSFATMSRIASGKNSKFKLQNRAKNGPLVLRGIMMGSHCSLAVYYLTINDKTKTTRVCFSVLENLQRDVWCSM
jgi:hypothetical protein